MTEAPSIIAQEAVDVRVTRSSLSITNCPKELAEMLRYTRLDIKLSEGNFVSQPLLVSYAAYDDRKRVCRTYPNALHFVRQHAQALGCSLSLNDQRVLPELDPGKLDKNQFRSVCFSALEAVAKARSSGLILGPTGIGKTSIICGLLQMLPKDFKVLVTTEDRNVARQIYKAIAAAIPGEKIGLHCKPNSDIQRITVTHLDALKDFTQGEIAYSGYDLKGFDCWICDEVHRLPVPSRTQFLSQFRPVYAWGLTATHDRADNSHVLNEVVFGPVLFSISHREAIAVQEQSNEAGIAPLKVMVFPLTTEQPVSEELPLFSKIRKVYLKNPNIHGLLLGIMQQITGNNPTAKVLIFVDTRALGFQIKKWMPGITFVHGNQSVEHRQQILDKLKEGEITHVVCTDIWSEGIDVPDLAYVVDCSAKVSPTRVVQRGGRAARSSDNKASGCYIMLLCCSSLHLFNQGVSKLRNISSLGWEVNYLFSRDYIKSLPFDKAPLLVELGKCIA
jgi:superfamily II DNA or RNA helicase